MPISDIFIWEALGTAVLILLGNGAVATVVPKDSLASSMGAAWVVIVLGWGFAVFAGVSVAAPSGGHINPAVSISLALNGQLAWSLVPVYVGAQLVGAIAGSVLCWLAFKVLFDAHDDNANTRGIFCTVPAIRRLGWNFVTEAIATFVLIIWVLTNPETNGGLGAAGVAFVVITIGFGLGGPTGYAINPARDLGPRIAYAILPIPGKAKPDWGYSWVPILGPIVGGAIAVLLFKALP